MENQQLRSELQAAHSGMVQLQKMTMAACQGLVTSPEPQVCRSGEGRQWGGNEEEHCSLVALLPRTCPCRLPCLLLSAEAAARQPRGVRTQACGKAIHGRGVGRGSLLAEQWEGGDGFWLPFFCWLTGAGAGPGHRAAAQDRASSHASSSQSRSYPAGVASMCWPHCLLWVWHHTFAW